MNAPATTELVPLAVEVRGAIISSNLAEFHKQVSAALAKINYEPSSDEEFGKAEDLVKGLKAIEESVRDARVRALAGSSDLQTVLSEMETLTEELAQARCKLTNKIKVRKEQRREELIAAALLTIHHPKRGVFLAPLTEAIKGKRELASMHSALENICDEINARIVKARAILAEFEAENGADLIADHVDLELLDPATLPDKLIGRAREKTLRDEAAKAKAEAERLRVKMVPTVAPAPAPVAPAPQPAAPPPAPVAQEGRSPSEEWGAFRQCVCVVADQLKAERSILKHEINQRRAAEFMRLLNDAWKSVQKINA